MNPAHAVKRTSTKADHLATLVDLLSASRTDPARLFEHGLALLVERLGVDRALLTRVTGLGYEVFWWAAAEGATMTGVFETPEKGFCPWVLAHPDRSLTIRDAASEPQWSKSSAWLDLGIRAYAGVALTNGNGALGTLCVQHHAPRAFNRGETALLRAMGHLMARTLESENLKHELRAALDALELSSAILEDSALQSPRSGLPNRHYLDVWLRASLFMARRRQEPMALALWSQPLVAHPTGATLWLPEDEDMTLKSALTRVGKAFTQASREGSPLIWNPARG